MSINVCGNSATACGMTAALAASTGYCFNNITTNTTTIVKSGPGTLNSVNINTKGSGTVAILYDSVTASGTKIATIDTSVNGPSALYNLAFTIGLTVVTTGKSPADLTLTYK